MSYRGHASAVANDLPLPPIEGRFDLSPTLSKEERAALRAMAQAYDSPDEMGPSWARRALKRLSEPIDFVLDWIGEAYATRCYTKRIVIKETNRIGCPLWAWSNEQCLEVVCANVASFNARHREGRLARQQVLALMCLMAGFNCLTEIGRFNRFHLASKVFGRLAIERATDQVYAEMAKVGLKTHTNYGVAHALHTAFLMERRACIECITFGTLRRIADAGPCLLRRAAASISRMLIRIGVLEEPIDNYLEAQKARHLAPTEHHATDSVPLAWVHWCDRWRSTAVGSRETCEKTYFGVLKFARWLGVMHPDIVGPAAVTREVAIDYVTAVDRMKVGEWANPFGNAARTMGKPMTAASKAAHINMVRRFLGDLQEWEWIPKRFELARVLAVPTPIRSLIGPSPRVVADDVWAKIVWAGLNIEEADIQPQARSQRRGRSAPYYPIELVRAIANLWLFAGLRSDDIHRLTVGCIRWQGDRADPSSMICLLDVPVGKTATAFAKPVDAVVGQAVEAWERVRCPHPKMLDRKIGALVDFLFAHRGRRVAKSYINETLIPLICSKAGVPQADARGPITSHRARATIATQLYNAKEPMTLFELKDWLGHADVRSTQHYAALTPTKLAGAFRRAGYFERNLRTIAVLVDGAAVRNGASARGEPWRFYDLGHGFCTYDFFDQCPHRMACAKCSFYLPKDSGRAQAIEASGNLTRMLQEIPLRDEERAAVEDGLDAMAKLSEGLRDTATPDGRTPAEIEAERGGIGRPVRCTVVGLQSRRSQR